jgi:hypothetical protein
VIENKLLDFSGEIEWLNVGACLYIDFRYRAIDDLIQLSLSEVEELASSIQNEGIDEKEQVPMLKSLLRNRQHRYEQLYISDARGDYFNADGQKNNITDRAYFQHVMSGETVVSEPIINKSTKRPCIAVAAPIWNERTVVGLFGATILIGSMHKGLRFLPFGRTGDKPVQGKRLKGTRPEESAKNVAMKTASR